MSAACRVHLLGSHTTCPRYATLLLRGLGATSVNAACSVSPQELTDPCAYPVLSRVLTFSDRTLVCSASIMTRSPRAGRDARNSTPESMQDQDGSRGIPRNGREPRGCWEGQAVHPLHFPPWVEPFASATPIRSPPRPAAAAANAAVTMRGPPRRTPPPIRSL